MTDARENFKKASERAAQWNAKKEVLQWIAFELAFTENFRDDLNESYKALYISALNTLSQDVLDAYIAPWEERKE